MILKAAASGLEGKLKGHTSLKSVNLNSFQFVPVVEDIGLPESTVEADLMVVLALCTAPLLAIFLD